VEEAGTRAAGSEKAGKSADSPQRHDAALQRSRRDCSARIQTRIPCSLQERQLEGSRGSRGSRGSQRHMAGSCDDAGSSSFQSIDLSVPEHCSCSGHGGVENSTARGSTSLQNHVGGARTCRNEGQCTPRKLERHWRHRSGFCKYLYRRNTSWWLLSILKLKRAKEHPKTASPRHGNDQ
jgi:hypothetical protein